MEAWKLGPATGSSRNAKPVQDDSYEVVVGKDLRTKVDPTHFSDRAGKYRFIVKLFVGFEKDKTVPLPPPRRRTTELGIESDDETLEAPETELQNNRHGSENRENEMIEDDPISLGIEESEEEGSRSGSGRRLPGPRPLTNKAQKGRSLRSSRDSSTWEIVTGTGYLVEKNVVVTAGHCLTYHGNASWVSAVIGYVGDPTSESQSGEYFGSIAAVPVRWALSRDKQYDAGFVLLEKAFEDMEPVPYSTTPDEYPKKLKELKVVGFPSDLEHGNRMYESPAQCHGCVSKAPARGRVKHIGSTGTGSSGSPLLKEVGESGKFVALATHTGGNLQAGRNYATTIGTCIVFESYIGLFNDSKSKPFEKEPTLWNLDGERILDCGGWRREKEELRNDFIQIEEDKIRQRTNRVEKAMKNMSL